MLVALLCYCSLYFNRKAIQETIYNMEMDNPKKQNHIYTQEYILYISRHDAEIPFSFSIFVS